MIKGVQTSRYQHEELSREVHRIGYHFPSTIVDRACLSLGITLTNSGKVAQSKIAFFEDQASSHDRRSSKRKQRRSGRTGSPNFDITLSQAIIDTQARDAIRDLFPNIPGKDLHEIIARAFQKVCR